MLNSFESNEFVASDLISKDAKVFTERHRALADDHALITTFTFSHVHLSCSPAIMDQPILLWRRNSME